MKTFIIIITIAACLLLIIGFGIQIMKDLREAFGDVLPEMIRDMKIRIAWAMRKWYMRDRGQFIA